LYKQLQQLCTTVVRNNRRL